MTGQSDSRVQHGEGRVVIVGGGIAGLSTATLLVQAGVPVTVLEASRLGAGASTRNQGWLHSGAWFAPQRTELASQCLASFQRTLQFCPECVDTDTPPMVFLTSTAQTDPRHWTAAWKQASIGYEEIGLQELVEQCPGLAISQVQRAYRLPDRSIRTDVLLGRMAEVAEQAGVEIRYGCVVSQLLSHGQRVHGVILSDGMVVPAQLVILAGNAKGGALYPGFGAEPVGAEAGTALVALKTHLVSVRPGLAQAPLCVVDADGFNHLPHQSVSVFGTSRWLLASHGEDEQLIPEETDRLWGHIQRLFPDYQPQDHEALQWAGTTVQAMAVDQIDTAQLPRPLVVDHQRERTPLQNLVSIFPGRASLWAQVADEACTLVREKLGLRKRDVARPPWESGSVQPSSSS